VAVEVFADRVEQIRRELLDLAAVEPAHLVRRDGVDVIPKRLACKRCR
jgi:hypothetical protein